MIGVSRRIISYYEQETESPPAKLMPNISKTLGISIEELLGIKKIKLNNEDSKKIILLRKLNKTLKLPEKDQKAVINFIDALLQKNKTE